MDIHLIRHLAKEYDDGRRDPEAVLAAACLEAYNAGFEDGVKATERQFIQTQMLMLLTAGSA